MHALYTLVCDGSRAWGSGFRKTALFRVLVQIVFQELQAESFSKELEAAGTLLKH